MRTCNVWPSHRMDGLIVFRNQTESQKFYHHYIIIKGTCLIPLSTFYLTKLWLLGLPMSWSSMSAISFFKFCAKRLLFWGQNVTVGGKSRFGGLDPFELILHNLFATLSRSTPSANSLQKENQNGKNDLQSVPKNYPSGISRERIYMLFQDHFGPVWQLIWTNLHHLGPFGIDKKVFLWLECVTTKHDEECDHDKATWILNLGMGGLSHIPRTGKNLSTVSPDLWPMSVTLTFCCKGSWCRPSKCKVLAKCPWQPP